MTRSLGILSAQRDLGWETTHLTAPRQNPANVDVEKVDGWVFHRTRRPRSILSRVPVASYWAEMKATERRLETLARESRPDIIHAHSPLLNGYPAHWVGRRLGIPVVYEVRAFWEDAAVNLNTASPGGLRVRATRRAETGLFRNVDAVVALCQGVRSEIVRRGIPAEKVSIVQNSVVIDRFPPTRTRDETLARSLGIDRRTVIGFIGSFYDYEGLDQLLRAIPAIRNDHAVKVLLVGGGPMEEHLKRTARDLGIGETVVFPGRVSFEDVNRYYDLIDVFVFPRKKIRLTDLVTPLKPIEAMAKKRIVIASDVGGHREMIDDGKTGFLFAADSVEALTLRLREVLERRDLWPDIQEAGRSYVETERTWSAVGRAYETVYRGILGS